MNLLIDNRTDEPLTAELEDAIRRAAAEALRYEEFDEDCEISVSIVDNEEIREINRQFRSIDRACNVLSLRGSGDRWCMVVVSSCREMLG